ncbi:hypothetical protein C8Q70DRAFT_937470 [Cubamyces menziesii]|nr:hypothetical protein C8Q70DRAFT_937470 [Cubamyces menziesii]
MHTGRSAHWVAEDKEVYNAWKTWCDSHTLKDKREGHFPVHRLNGDALVYMAEADESVLFYDASRKLVAFKIVNAIAEDISQGRFYKKSVRLDNPGFIAHSGYTSGHQGDSQGFRWACNLHYAKHRNDPVFLKLLEHRESSLAAFFWNFARGSLPNEVTGAYTSYLEENALPRMAPGPVDFEPHAMCTHNYARCIHKGVCPQGWMFSWTLARPDGPSRDGNFLIPGYRIKIASSANSCVGWLPNKWHGMTLRRLGSDDLNDVTLEVGLSFQLSPTLATRWKMFCDTCFDPDVLADCLEKLRGEPLEELDEEGEEWEKDEGEPWE